MLLLARGEHRIPLVEAARLPFTLNGRARHNIENALAAAAALVALGIARDRIVAGLSTFTSGSSHNPLRLNVFRTHGIALLVDYAHNAAAYRAIIDTARQLTTRRLHGVVAAPGDRRDDDLVEVGRVCRAGFDELVLYELDEWRGRPAGATVEWLGRGVPAARAAARVVLDVHEALREAWRMARSGDALVLGCASRVGELAQALSGLVEIVAVDACTLCAALSTTPRDERESAAVDL